MDIPIINTEKEFLEIYEKTEVVMDAIFGMSSFDCIAAYMKLTPNCPFRHQDSPSIHLSDRHTIGSSIT